MVSGPLDKIREHCKSMKPGERLVFDFPAGMVEWTHGSLLFLANSINAGRTESGRITFHNEGTRLIADCITSEKLIMKL